MGTTSEKLTYLNGTKQKLKQAINNIGGEVTDETTFREYANQLQNVYDNLPKTEYQEGTEVTLSNTLKGKLDYDNGVVGIGQAEQDSTNGYNLLNLKDYAETINGVTITIRNGVITLNGTSTNYTTRLISQEPTNQLNGDYNLNYEYVSGSVSGTTNINLYDGTTEVVALYANNTSKNQNVSFSNKVVSTRLYYHNNAVFNNFTIKPMLYSGNYDSSKTFEPYTGGQASPNPSYPQEIKYVRGKNRFNVNNVTQISNGTAQTIINPNEIDFITGTGVWSNYAYIFKNPEKNTDFTIKAKFKSALARTTGISVYGSNTNDVSNLTNIKADTSNLTANTEKEYSVTFNSGNYNYICFRFWNNYSATALSENVTLNIYEIQLEKGSQATSYLPYNTIEEVVSGKNLFDKESITVDMAYMGNVNDTLSTGANGATFIAPLLKSNKESITISSNKTSATYRVRLVDSSNKIISSTAYTTMPQTIDVSNCDKIAIMFDKTTITIADNIQIEQGSTATTYEPYITPTSYQLSLGDIELCKIGDYQDYIWTDRSTGKWYKHSEIGKVVLNGTEDWVSFAYGTNSWRLSDIVSTNFNVNEVLILSRKFKGIAQANRNDDYAQIYFDSRNLFTIRNTTYTTKAEVQSGMNSEPLYYVLATATDTEITDTTLINQVEAWYNAHSNNGTTIITSNGNLPMIIKVRALKGES